MIKINEHISVSIFGVVDFISLSIAYIVHVVEVSRIAAPRLSMDFSGEKLHSLFVFIYWMSYIYTYTCNI